MRAFEDSASEARTPPRRTPSAISERGSGTAEDGRLSVVWVPRHGRFGAKKIGSMSHRADVLSSIWAEVLGGVGQMPVPLTRSSNGRVGEQFNYAV